MANPKSLCGEQNLGKRGILTFFTFLTYRYNEANRTL